jgi:tetratricopeptide (TPR) repeat protein
VIASSLQTELAGLFEQRSYQAILDRVQRDEITPAADPQAANVVAAALFQLGRYSDCLLWCEGVAPALQGDASFASMYGAVLRRIGRLEAAEKVFRQALSQHPANPFLRNNFANLLIDRQAFEEAEAILRDLLALDSNYQDAQANLNRLQFQRDLAAASPAASATQPAAPPTDAFVDPLMAAFSDEEVARAGGLAVSPSPASAPGVDLSTLPARALDRELQETLALARQTIAADPQQAIQDCRMLHAKLGAQAPIYEVAAEAYIQLQLFADAETALLVALGLGSVDASVFLNLANLAAMRGDQKLALHWLEQLAQRQPDHPQLAAVRRTLFPKGVPTTSSSPFQVNLDQRAPGQFT